MTQTESPADSTDPQTPDPLTAARTALAYLHAFTEKVTDRINDPKDFVGPDVQAGWRRHQDDINEVVRTNALVSIAISLDAIARTMPDVGETLVQMRYRPANRIEVLGDRG